MSGGFLKSILHALGLDRMTLGQIKQMAATVDPGAMEAMAEVYELGSQSSNTNGTQLSAAIDKVVTGWHGQAADSASTKVLQTSYSSRELASTSTVAAENVRQYAAQVRQSQQQIAQVQEVDTSYATAVNNSGGPVVAAFDPAAAQAKQNEAFEKENKHRDQAQSFLDTMNADGNDIGQRQPKVYPAPPGEIDKPTAPARLSVERPVATVTGPGPGPRPIGGPGPGGPGPGGPGPGGPGPGSIGVIKNPKGGGSGLGSGDGSGHPVVVGPVDGTSPTGGGVPSGTGTSAPPAAASIGPVDTGGGNAGLIGGLAAGGGALAVGGALATRGGLGVNGRGAATLRGGAGSGEAYERGLGRGAGASGAGAVGEEVPPRSGVGARGGLGASESTPLRGNAFGSAAAESAAAESRAGYLPPGAGAGGRRNDDDELNARPDYLVESDEIWGDGRLAAPPVLG